MTSSKTDWIKLTFWSSNEIVYLSSSLLLSVSMVFLCDILFFTLYVFIPTFMLLRPKYGKIWSSSNLFSGLISNIFSNISLKFLNLYSFIEGFFFILVFINSNPLSHLLIISVSMLIDLNGTFPKSIEKMSTPTAQLSTLLLYFCFKNNYGAI